METPQTNPRPTLRDEHGRFRKGTRGGPGYPYAGRVEQLRAALMKAVTHQDIREIVWMLIRTAKHAPKAADRIAAAKEVLDRAVGHPGKSLSAQVLEGANITVKRVILSDGDGREVDLELGTDDGRDATTRN